MKKIFFGMFLAMAGISANAQLEAIYVEEIPVSQAAADADVNLTTNHVTYRIFIDMEDGNEYQLMQGGNLQPLKFETTTQFYNDEMDGVTGAADFTAIPTTDEPVYYDTWVTIGGYASRRAATQLVPLAEDTDGTVDGFFGDPVPLEYAFAPGLEAEMEVLFGFDNVPGSYISENSIVYVGGGVVGVGPSNSVCIGQFTTDGEFSFTLGGIRVRNLETRVSTLYVYEYAQGVQVQSDLLHWPAPSLVAPTATISAPSEGSSVAKGETVTITAEGNDEDGDVVSLRLLVNGVLQEEVQNPGDGIATDFSWICPGGTAATFTVIATDNDGLESDVASVRVVIIDENPTVVALTSPSADTTINLNAITLIAQAYDNDEGVTQVQFLVNGSVLSTDTDNSDGFSAEFAPTAIGTYSINAIATNGANGQVASEIVVVSVINQAPSVAIEAPEAPFVLIIENDTLIEASVADADGSVVAVEFFVNGSSTPAIIDNNASDGFSFNFTALPSHIGTVSITAVAVDNGGARSAQASLSFSVSAGSNSPKYMIQSVEAYCSASDLFYLPVVTAAPVDGVIGYDFELTYDPAKVSPTGLVEISADLLGNREYATYKLNTIDNVIYISLFLNSNAPVGTTFSGEGQVVGIEFTRNFNFGDEESADFTMPVVAESYPRYVLETSAFAGTYTSIKETLFNGTLTFWSDNSPISYVEGVNAITEISGDINPLAVTTPDENGMFVHNIIDGSNISINRDVDNAFDVQPVISGEDAYYTALVAVQEKGFVPNVYQIIAMDVNRDGRVSAGDISQMQQRTIGAIGEFAQADDMAKDWVFIKTGDILSNPSYRVSSLYPASDGIGFSRLTVPAVADLIELPVDNSADCPIIEDENFKGILLGDVTGNYAAQPSSPQLKSDDEKSPLILEIKKELNNGIATLNIAVNSESNITSYDFSIDLNESNVEFVKAIDMASMNEMCNVTEDNVLKCSAYNFGKYKEGNLIALQLKADAPLKSEDIAIITSNINEKKVKMTIKEMDQVTSVRPADVEVSVYPNPASDKLNVRAEAGAIITLHNSLSQIIATLTADSDISSIDISALAKGVYVVKIISENSVSDFEVVIE